LLLENKKESDNRTSKARIMVVDDDPELLQIAARTLELEGFAVGTADSGEAALALLPKFKPQIVILDVMMPGLDGYQTLELIRKQSDVPVLMLTALNNTGSVEKSLDLGADRYVTKPFRTAELLARIRALLRRVENQNNHTK
jgi:DNA-binding response OmpR family regulator